MVNGKEYKINKDVFEKIGILYREALKPVPQHTKDEKNMTDGMER